MHYKNGREAQVGDPVVGPNGVAGTVVRLLAADSALEILSARERQRGELCAQRPTIAVGSRHWEPVVLAAERPEEFLHSIDALAAVSEAREAKLENEKLREELAAMVANSKPIVVLQAIDPQQPELMPTEIEAPVVLELPPAVPAELIVHTDTGAEAILVLPPPEEAPAPIQPS